MYVRMLTGRYKGLIREARPAIAKIMLEDGRAERVYAEVDGNAEPQPAKPTEPPLQPAVAVQASAHAQAAKPAAPPQRGRRRGR